MLFILRPVKRRPGQYVFTYQPGNLWMAGRNQDGQLGDNTTVDKSVPVQTVAGGSNWKQAAGGNWFSAAIKSDGTLWMCGYNTTFGTLGINNTTANRSSPVQTIAGGNNWAQVTASPYNTAAVKTDGTLWVWGYNTDGQLGTNNTTAKSSPVQTALGGTDWKQVSIKGHVMAAIKTDGTLWTWGRNAEGQLGIGTNIPKSSPVQTIAGGTNWKQVACGGLFVAAIKTDGTLWTWGRNSEGQLGDNTTSHKSSPIQTIASGNNWSSVACGYTTTMGIKTDGALWVWGSNNQGQLGINTTAWKSSPVQTIAGGNDWAEIDGGNNHMAAIKTDGTLWTWGLNNYGQLMDNTRTNRSSPVQTIAGGTSWKSVACGNDHTLAIS